MAELADAADSKSADLRVLGVRLPLPAPGSFCRSPALDAFEFQRSYLLRMTQYRNEWPRRKSGFSKNFHESFAAPRVNKTPINPPKNCTPSEE